MVGILLLLYYFKCKLSFEVTCFRLVWLTICICFNVFRVPPPPIMVRGPLRVKGTVGISFWGMGGEWNDGFWMEARRFATGGLSSTGCWDRYSFSLA